MTGTAGTSGSSGSSGSSGTSASGSAGTSGSSGSSGSSGTSFGGGLTGATGEVAFFNSGTSITSDSNLFWDNTNKWLRVGGTTGPNYPLQVWGSTSGISIYASDDIAAFSDQSVKTDIEEIQDAIQKVKEIRGVTFRRTDTDSTLRRAGVIAQEVEKVLPEVVTTNPDGTKAVSYGNLNALLIQAIKELTALVEQQAIQIEDLKKRIP
jgi:hypothetical protein